MNPEVEAERGEALGQAEDGEQQLIKLQWEVNQVKRELEDTCHEDDHEVHNSLEEGEIDLANVKDHATQLELDDTNDRIDQREWKLESCERDTTVKDRATQLDDTNDRIDQLEWKLESRECEMELQVSRVKRAYTNRSLQGT